MTFVWCGQEENLVDGCTALLQGMIVVSKHAWKLVLIRLHSPYFQPREAITIPAAKATQVYVNAISFVILIALHASSSAFCFVSSQLCP